MVLAVALLFSSNPALHDLIASAPLAKVSGASLPIVSRVNGLIAPP